MEREMDRADTEERERDRRERRNVGGRGEREETERGESQIDIFLKQMNKPRMETKFNMDYLTTAGISAPRKR